MTSRSSRTQLRRKPDRGVEDRSALDQILDQALVANVGYVRDGEPVLIPTLCVRDGDRLILHGSPAAGHLRAARRGQMLCVTATVVDGLVLARSALHHSINYRSAVVFGNAHRLDGSDKRRALDRVVESVVPGRLATLRAVTDIEIRSTEVMALDLDQASVKVRSGPPIDEEPDYELPIWAGVIPVSRAMSEPISDPRSMPGLSIPDHVRALLA